MKVYLNKIRVLNETLRNSKLNCSTYKIYNKNMLLFPIFLWKNIEIYLGNKYIPLTVNKKKIGFFCRNFIFKLNNSLQEKKEYNIKINN